MLEDGSAVVNLGAIGLNFETGADQMRLGIENGLQEAAKGQVQMLDGMIQVVETMAAMEELGQIAGEDIMLQLPTIDFDAEENQDTLAKMNEWRLKYVQKFIEGSEEYDEDVAKAVNNIKYKNEKGATIALADIFKKDIADWTELEKAIMSGYYKAAKSGKLNDQN